MERRMKRVLARYNETTSVFVMDSLQPTQKTVERMLDDHGIDYEKVKIITDDYKPLNLVK